MASGPIQTGVAGRAADRWEARPWAARMLRLAIAISPGLIALGWTLLWVLWLSHERLGLPFIIWFLIVIAGAVTIAMGVERLARRALPAAALLRLSLVFPDEAPSRYRFVLRSGSSKRLAQRIHRGEGSADELELGPYLIDLVDAIGRHEPLTRGHSERVRAYCDLIGEELGLSDHERSLLQWSALLHDVGKLEVPAEILAKPGRLTDAEWRTVSTHPTAAEHYLEPVKEWLGPWGLAAVEHHERWDGNGYPRGLKGPEISVGAKVVAVADAFDVMTSVRHYKKPLSYEDARIEIARVSGEQFCPEVVKAFMRVSVGRLSRLSVPMAILGAVPSLVRQLGRAGAAGGLVLVLTSAGPPTPEPIVEPPPTVAFVEEVEEVKAPSPANKRDAIREMQGDPSSGGHDGSTDATRADAAPADEIPVDADDASGGSGT